MPNALVTGSAGFIGRHMRAELEQRGWDVNGIDYMPAPGNLITPEYDTDMMKVLPTIRTKFELVVHAAYHVGGRAAIDGTNTNFPKNVALDGLLFDWAIQTRQSRVLYFSSSAVYPVHLQHDTYGTRPQIKLDEDRQSPKWDQFRGAPDANYGWAKLTGERLAEDARRSGLPVTVVRPFSGYGEDQNAAEYPFPAIIKRASQGDLTVWGPAGQTRDWIHASDVAGAALAVMESGTTEPVNLCTGVPTEMGDLALAVARAAHSHDPHRYPGINADAAPTYLPDMPTGVFYRVGNPDRLHQYYTPKISIQEGVRRAVEAM